jgi:hypothetical protein
MKDDGQGNQVPVKDTLIIQWYTVPGGRITKGTLQAQNGSPAQVFATVGWNISTLSPTNFLGSTKIVLDENDSTTVRSNDGGFENAWTTKVKMIGFDQPITIAPKGVSDNLVAFTFQFKPGHAYDSNSVMIYQADTNQFPFPAGATRTNYFGYRFFQNAGTIEQQVPQTKFYNNSLFVDKNSGYFPSSNGSWSGYIPGNAFFENRYLQADVRLTSTNVGLKDIKNENFAMTSVYPNPANVNGTAVMGFNLRSASTVSISIYNIAGQLAKTVINKNYAAGEHAEEFSLAGLNPGIYMVNMTVNGVSQTKKLTITE